jgi:hypothetical protein
MKQPNEAFNTDSHMRRDAPLMHAGEGFVGRRTKMDTDYLTPMAYEIKGCWI